MVEIRQSPQSRIDIVDIWTYIAEDNIEAADLLIDQINSRILKLSNMPLQGEAVPSIREGVRRISVGNCVVYYEPIDRGIQVIRILHGARDHENLL